MQAASSSADDEEEERDDEDDEEEQEEQPAAKKAKVNCSCDAAACSKDCVVLLRRLVVSCVCRLLWLLNPDAGGQQT